MATRSRLWPACLSWCLTAAVTAGAAAAGPAAVVDPAVVDPAVADPPFQGWGVSLCWWAKVAGGYPEPARSALMDRLFDARVGLGLNVVRYNIGGGDDPASAHPLPFRAAVPGYEPAPGRWDWSADAGQRWVLAAAVRRGADRLQAFSNGPPYWMTVSGTSTGSRDGGDNLRPDQVGPFADYLATVCRHFRDRWGVAFGTLEPMNEPASDWWRAGGRQEGCHFGRAAQDRVVAATGRALRRQGLSTTVAAADENSVDDAAESFAALSDPARAFVTTITTHTYNGHRRAALAGLARESGRDLWVSEYDDADRTGLRLAGRIVADLRGLHPEAWVAWQAGDGGGWGLFDADLRRPDGFRWRANPKSDVVAQFSRHVRPGCRLVFVGDPDAIAAVDARAGSLTVVAVNATGHAVDRAYDLGRFTTVGPVAAAWRTSPTEGHAAVAGVPLRGVRLAVTLPPSSVTTWVVPATAAAGVGVADGTDHRHGSSTSRPAN